MARKKKTFPKDYEYWVINLVDALENKKYLDSELYSKIIEKYPKVQPVLAELIQQVRMFSIYDQEPATVNFDYRAYLLKIKNLIE